MIRIKINVSKIDKSKLFVGDKGTYLDVTLIESHGDRFGNDYMAVQDIGKEARERGEKGPILGNAKVYHPRDAQPARPAAKASGDSASPVGADEDVPF